MKKPGTGGPLAIILTDTVLTRLLMVVQERVKRVSDRGIKIFPFSTRFMGERIELDRTIEDALTIIAYTAFALFPFTDHLQLHLAFEVTAANIFTLLSTLTLDGADIIDMEAAPTSIIEIIADAVLLRLESKGSEILNFTMAEPFNAAVLTASTNSEEV